MFAKKSPPPPQKIPLPPKVDFVKETLLTLVTEQHKIIANLSRKIAELEASHDG